MPSSNCTRVAAGVVCSHGSGRTAPGSSSGTSPSRTSRPRCAGRVSQDVSAATALRRTRLGEGSACRFGRHQFVAEFDHCVAVVGFDRGDLSVGELVAPTPGAALAEERRACSG